MTQLEKRPVYTIHLGTILAAELARKGVHHQEHPKTGTPETSQPATGTPASKTFLRLSI